MGFWTKVCVITPFLSFNNFLMSTQLGKRKKKFGLRYAEFAPDYSDVKDTI